MSCKNHLSAASQYGSVYIDRDPEIRYFPMESKNLMKQSRCILCRGSIVGETIVKYLDGQRLEFDRNDCQAIFERLTAVYGINFGLTLRDS